MASYLDSIRERSVYPNTSSREIREKLDRVLPEEGVPFEGLLDIFSDVIVPASRHNGHPRMFGYVQAPGTAIAALADLLASTLNANLTAWRSAPAAVEIERLTIDWIKQILGVEAHAAGLFVSGGSMANLAALAAARRARAPADLTSKGAQSLGRAMRVYVSEETHHSIAKAAALLGLGRDNVRTVGVDERFKIRIDDLVAKITEDLEAGHLPFCVVANAGTVNTGACDPLAGSQRGRAAIQSLDARRCQLRRASPRWRIRRETCSRACAKPIRSRSIRTSGSTCRSIAVVCCIATRRRRARPSRMTPNTPACWNKRRTKRSLSGITVRSFRAVFGR